MLDLILANMCFINLKDGKKNIDKNPVRICFYSVGNYYRHNDIY